jgi:hypothetical protein
MTAIAETLGQQIGLKPACAVLKVPRSRLYRARQPQVQPTERPLPASALSDHEREQVRQVLNSERSIVTTCWVRLPARSKAQS